jgi:hypothetical protein
MVDQIDDDAIQWRERNPQDESLDVGLLFTFVAWWRGK